MAKKNRRPASPEKPGPKLRQALAALVVLAVGLVALTDVTWAQIGHWALVLTTVVAGVVVLTFAWPYARRVVAALR
jgi:uncharacterized membrane protein